MKENKERKKLELNKNYLITIPVIIIISIVVYFLLTPEAAWSVSTEEGTVLINDRVISKIENLSMSDIVKTSTSSSAIIQLPKTGRIEIHQSTIIKRLDDNNSISLIEGNIIVDTRDEKEKLQVKIPSAVIEEYYLSDKYFLHVDDQGNSEIEVFSSWLEVKSGKEYSIIPEGYKVKVLKGASASIPYLSGSDPHFIQLLDDYLYGGKILLF